MAHKRSQHHFVEINSFIHLLTTFIPLFYFTMLQTYLVWSALAISLLPRTFAFSPTTLGPTATTNERRRQGEVVTTQTVVSDSQNHQKNVGNNGIEVSRRNALSAVVAASVFLPMNAVQAEDDGGITTTTTPSSSSSSSYSVKKCPTPSNTPCVSTANVRQLDLYSTPWTFDVSPDEVMSRLKGAIVADPGCEILEQDGNAYLKAQGKNLNSNSILEFVINSSDQIVLHRSEADGNDLGANKRRVEEIRKRTGVLGKMGETLDSADSKSSAEQGYGPLGQLKAFYGLQSGAGFEDVVKN